MLKKLINLSLVLSMVVSLVCVGTPTVSADEDLFADPTKTTGVYKTLYSQNFDSLESLDGAGFTMPTADDGSGDNAEKKSDVLTLGSDNEGTNKYLNWKRNFKPTADKTMKKVFVESGYTSGKIVMSAKIKVNLTDGDTTEKYFEMGTTPGHWGGIANKFQIYGISSNSFGLYVTAKDNARATVNADMVNSFCRIDFVHDLDSKKGEIYVNGKSVMSEIPLNLTSSGGVTAVNALSLCMRSGTSSADIDIDDLFVGKELNPAPQTTGEYKQIYLQNFDSLTSLDDSKITFTATAEDSESSDNKGNTADTWVLKDEQTSNKYLNWNRKFASTKGANIKGNFDEACSSGKIVMSAKLKVNSGSGNIEMHTGDNLNIFQINNVGNNSFNILYSRNNDPKPSNNVVVNENIRTQYVRIDFYQDIDAAVGEVYVNGDCVMSNIPIQTGWNGKKGSLGIWELVVRENSAALDMDIDDIYVGKKIPEYEIKEITKSGESITGVKLDKGAQNGSGRTLYVAVFGADGNLKTVTFQSVDDVAMGTDVSVTLNNSLTAADGDKVMAMIWNADLSPVCAAKE